jgi:hypothetical protein
MKNTIKTLTLALVVTGSASAASITWSPVIVNTTAGDISTDGTLHSSSNSSGSTDQTINGVTFSANASGPLASNAGGTFYTTGGGVNTTGDIGLDTLLDSHSYQGGGGANFDIIGLTPGDTYQIQIIAVGDTRGCCATREQNYSGDGVVVSGDLLRADPSSVLGTFVADGSTQNIMVGGTTDPGLSGYQVRNVAVPEPSGVLLLGLSGMAFLFRRRK